MFSITKLPENSSSQFLSKMETKYYQLPSKGKTRPLKLNLRDFDDLEIYLISKPGSEQVELLIAKEELALSLSSGRICLRAVTSSIYCFEVRKSITNSLILIATKIERVNLDREMARYRTCMAIDHLLTEKLNPDQQYEARNILERWLLALANDKGALKVGDAIFSSAKLAPDYPATIKMEEEICKKSLPILDRISSIRQLAQQFLNTNIYTAVQEYKLVDDGVQIDEIIFTLSPKRKELLLDRFPSLYHLATMVVRYACLLPRGQQWGIPDPIYKLLAERYEVKIEGFASPLNSQLMIMGKEMEFCSLFSDTDAPYGSLGDFFEVDFKKEGKEDEGNKEKEYTGILINAPFIVSLLDRVVAKITSDLKGNHPLAFFFLVPEWTDAPFYKELVASTFRRTDFQLRGRTYYFVDSMRDTIIPAKFTSHFFVLSNIMIDLSRLRTDVQQSYRQ